MNTPWGNGWITEQYARGFSSISTAGHGGFAIANGFAEKHLSEAARKRAIRMAGYHFYEEDCDWAIPALELPEFWPQIFQYARCSDPRGYLLRIVSSLCPEYLVERGLSLVEA